MAVSEASGAKNGRSAEDGALYSVKDRLNTFQDDSCHWPYDRARALHSRQAAADFCTGARRVGGLGGVYTGLRSRRWRRRASTTAATRSARTGCAAWSARTTWRGGSQRTSRGTHARTHGRTGTYTYTYPHTHVPVLCLSLS